MTQTPIPESPALVPYGANLAPVMKNLEDMPQTGQTIVDSEPKAPHGYFEKEFALYLQDKKRETPVRLDKVHHQLYAPENSYYYGYVVYPVVEKIRLGEYTTVNKLENDAWFNGVDTVTGMSAYLLKEIRKQYRNDRTEDMNGYDRYMVEKGKGAIQYKNNKPMMHSPLLAEQSTNDVAPAITEEDRQKSFHRSVRPTYFRDRVFDTKGSRTLKRIQRQGIHKAARRQNFKLKKLLWEQVVEHWTKTDDILVVPPPPPEEEDSDSDSDSASDSDSEGDGKVANWAAAVEKDLAQMEDHEK